MEPEETQYKSPPRSPSWQVPEPPPVPPDVERTDPKLQKRQSLRLRPSVILDNAEPASPLNLSSKSAPPPLTSRMSLLNLFGRPNVERARSYAEPGIDVAPPNSATASKQDLVIHVRPEKPTPRPASIISGKTTATKWKFKRGTRSALPHTRERKSGAFEPPPLFQAYPQSAKDGLLEVASISIDTLNKTKSKSTTPNGTLGEKHAEERASIDSKRTSALKYIANGTTATVDLPKKIFVLITSGYLLQYAAKGVSDRLPEKVLHLGKDSVAFACDLVPGKHYVLQVSQTVNEDGIVIANSGSILSRLGIRSAAAKRMASNMILVMPSAAEMDSWISALSQEIEAAGGKRIRHYAMRTSNKNTDAGAIDLKKTPSQSHRYQVKRNPSKPSSVTSPKPYQSSFPPVLPDIDLDRSDRSTLDEIEWEANMLNQYLKQSPESDHATAVELPAMPSPPTVAIEPYHDEPLNDDPVERVVISPAKQTVAAPTWNARRESLQVATPSIPASPDTPQESGVPLSAPSLARTGSSSHNFSRKAPPPPLNLSLQQDVPRRALVDESPIIPNYPMLSERMSTRLAHAYSERNFADTSPGRRRHDSKVPTFTLTTPASIDESKIDESRPNLLQRADSVPEVPTRSRTSLLIESSMIRVEPERPRKVASFSMPLKVNPTATNGTVSSGNVRRHSRMDEGGSNGEAKIGYALTPSVDASPVESDSHTQSSPSPTSHKYSSSNSLSGGLSLFPRPPSSTSSNEPFKRSSSRSQRQSYIQPIASTGSLKRPSSMQVRSDHAPFLASVRNSTGSSDTRTATSTVPIRGMKPSRSASNVAALARQSISPIASPIEELKALKFDTPTVEEEEDKAMPLPVETSVAATIKPVSRNSVRKSLRGRSSLPDLDFGIPVIGLGPPAPPPQAPLPAPPTGSRTTSPTPMPHMNGSLDTAVTGLGISVS